MASFPRTRESSPSFPLEGGRLGWGWSSSSPFEKGGLRGICLSAGKIKINFAGGCPAASHFLLLRQKKVTKEKATQVRRPLRAALRNGGLTGRFAKLGLGGG